MKTKFRIFLNDLNTFDFSTISDDLYIEFKDITDRSYFSTWFQEEDCLSIEINKASLYIQIDTWYSDSGTGNSITNNFDTLSTNGSYIDFVADCDFYPELLELEKLNIIKIIPLQDETLLHLYSLNSENNVLDKDITIRSIISGKFNHSIGVKSLNIDIVNLPMNFNYVYIPSLNRYYYVDSVEIISNDVRRLRLTEDVLMSWKTLIRMQNAFVTRSEVYNDKDVLIDERLPVKDIISYKKYALTHLSQKNVSFDYLQYNADDINNRNILINTYTENQYSSLDEEYISAPLNSGLPNISPLKTKQNFSALISLPTYKNLINACVKDDTTASFISSAIWLPFNATSVFPNIQPTTTLHAGKKVLDGVDGGKWVNYGEETNPIGSTWVHDGACPYLIVGDFYFNSLGGISDIDANAGIEIYKPYSKWEIYIPFVNWVEVDINQVKDKRIQIIYTMDMETGLSTAYVYNWTDKIVLYSATCQIGVRLSITTTNEIENTKQKQANDTNMILGTLSSVLSIGVGVASENPIAIAGGVLSATKTIANYVNSNNQLFERANVSFGSSSTALYSPNEIIVRRSHHNEISIDNDVYAHMQGYPSNTYGALSLHNGGYIEVGDIHFKPYNETIYQDEINEIVSLLKDGVII